MQENDDINTAYLKMIIDWMKMTRQFSLAAASTRPAPTERPSSAEHQPIVRRTPNSCPPNVKRLSGDRQTIVRRPPNDVVLIKLRQHYVITTYVFD